MATSQPDLILLDVMMPKMDGLSTLKTLKEQSKQIPVIMLTASSTVEDAVKAMKLGAIDYLNKPFDVAQLTDLIVNTLALPPNQPNQKINFPITSEIIGKSQLMQNVFKKIDQVAKRETTVLITGESGTGKELIAKEIHKKSLRHDKSFIAINCAAIPENLIESELFGHEKGAFTNAVEQHIGQFEIADGGTIFLDEIGELALPVQVKLLRFLQEREFYRIGRNKPVKVNVRIIAATNRNLEELIQEKTFREDLYYRLNVINIEVPPLRDRFDDIPDIINSFLTRYACNYDNRKLIFSENAMRLLIEYNWPGNVRELENIIESLLALAPNDIISEDDLPHKLKTLHHEILPTAFAGSLNFEDAEKEFESEIILKALKKTNWVQTRAADLLGISRRILKYKMDKLGIADNAPTEIS